jgi:hypothetical protein
MILFVYCVRVLEKSRWLHAFIAASDAIEHRGAVAAPKGNTRAAPDQTVEMHHPESFNPGVTPL